MTTRSSCAPGGTSTVEPSGLRTSTSHVAPFSESRSTAFACPPGTSLSAAALAASAPGPVAPPSPSSPPTALATRTPRRASASAAPPARSAFLELIMGGVLHGLHESPMRWRKQDRHNSSLALGSEFFRARGGRPIGEFHGAIRATAISHRRALGLRRPVCALLHAPKACVPYARSRPSRGRRNAGGRRNKWL